MKKFKLLALAFVIGTASLFAVNADDPENPSKEIRNQIVELLKAPDFTVEKEMNVVLTFTFSSNGEIVVLCAGCKDQEIVKYIRENLNYKKFKTPGLRDKIYKMPLKIKVA